MSRIENLIEELCPLGVRFSTLSSVAEISIGTKPSDTDKEKLAPHPYINGGVKPSGFVFETNTEAETITIPSRGSVGIVDFQKTPFWCGPLSYRIRVKNCAEISTTFLYYALKSIELKIVALQQSASIPALNKAQLEKVQVPIPPLEVQQEIVRILDTFTELEAELEAELESRKKQYEHYRNAILSFPGENIQWVPLSEAFDLITARTSQEIVENRYVGVEDLAKDKKGLNSIGKFTSSTTGIAFQPGDVLVGNIRPYLRKIWFAAFSGGTNGDVLTIRRKADFTERINEYFAYQVIASESFWEYAIQHSKGAKMPRGDKAAIMKFLFPIPPLIEQERIADLLGRFEMLVHKQDDGLPAEIKARRKQYAYYRERLLTFKELAA